MELLKIKRHYGLPGYSIITLRKPVALARLPFYRTVYCLAEPCSCKSIQVCAPCFVMEATHIHQDY